MTRHLTAGSPAPAFTLPDAEGAAVSLSDFAGRKTVVYFYPKAATPGCTTEACDFRDSLSALKGAGIDVVGISTDAPEELAKFAGDNSLGFPLLSDQDHQVAEAWGAWGEKEFNGKTFTGTLRSTFVVNEAGLLDNAEYDVAADGHVARLRTELGL